jgi:hypothetical protein
MHESHQEIEVKEVKINFLSATTDPKTHYIRERDYSSEAERSYTIEIPRAILRTRAI